MDPEAALRDWRDASLSQEERRGAREDLREWLARGGYLPRGMTMGERIEVGDVVPGEDA